MKWLAQEDWIFPITEERVDNEDNGLVLWLIFFERTAITFLRKHFVPARHTGADLLQFSVPETPVVVSGSKNIKSTPRHGGGKF